MAVDEKKAIGGGVKAGIGLLALVSGRGGIQEATDGVMTILESTGVVEGGKKETTTTKKEGPTKEREPDGPLTPEVKAEGVKIAKAAIARLGVGSTEGD